MQDDMQVMKLSTPLSQPLDAHNTIQTLSSLVDSTLDSYAVSLVFVGFIYCIYFIGWMAMSLVIFWIFSQTFGSDITIIGSNLRYLYSPFSFNCQCVPVVHFVPTVTLPYFGATIPWLFSAPYDSYSGISQPHELFFKLRKVLHQFGKKF